MGECLSGAHEESEDIQLNTCEKRTKTDIKNHPCTNIHTKLTDDYLLTDYLLTDRDGSATE